VSDVLSSLEYRPIVSVIPIERKIHVISSSNEIQRIKMMNVDIEFILQVYHVCMDP
jgi:hypothetical protein